MVACRLRGGRLLVVAVSVGGTAEEIVFLRISA